MTAISALSVDFEGTDGVYVYNTATSVNNPGAIGATQVTGSGTARFDGSNPKMGSTALRFDATANQVNARWDFTPVATTFWDDIYILTPSATGTGTPVILQWTDSTLATVVGSVRMNLADLSLQLRDGSTTVWTSAGLAPSTWVRLSIKSIPGSSTGHELKVYTSIAGNATSPDQQSGGVAATSAGAVNVASFRMGVLTNATMTFSVDRNRADNALEPAGLTTGNPPTVNAGPDLTKEVSTGTFTIAATDSPGGGLTISSRAWSILSGTAVTLSGQATATVTVTAPSTTGTTVLRYSVTDSAAQVTTDDVTLTWVAAGQTFYPVSDVSDAGAWTTQSGSSTGLFSVLDDPGTADNTDYIQSVQSPSAAAYRTRLTSRSTPSNTTGWYLSFTAWVSSDVGSSSVVWKLIDSDGTTVRKTWSAVTTLTTTPQEIQLPLTSGEVAAISGWGSGLILEAAATAS